MSIDDAKPKVSGDRVNVSDLFDVYKFENNKYKTFRLLKGDHLAVASHWLDYTTKAGKEVRFPKVCLSFDPETEGSIADKTCPYCEAGLKYVVAYYFNVIVRDLQDSEPSKKSKPARSEVETGFKARGSATWTPVRVLHLSAMLTTRVQGLKELNTHKIKGESTQCSIAHPKYGMDIRLKYDEKEKVASAKYTLNGGESSPLTEDEAAYLVYDLGQKGILKQIGQEDEVTANNEIRRLAENGSPIGSIDSKVGKSSKSDDDLNMTRSKHTDYDEDEDDDEPVTKAKSKKKPSYDEDDDDIPF